ncbi:copper resistance CopC family protein [Gryllotalpicola protaetiae]|uniref:Copper resistance protein CopC n=1 Tax=Gryllotalpicola protaetiae TaxID=2419771 RepID=A0A387BLG2_9MICO|nr:copper resistance CopC family protein [Gryllotalpicola protaetiae]AYG03202.1 copper resistance protein CopC [Gryllotalpicola protaetiae]
MTRASRSAETRESPRLKRVSALLGAAAAVLGAAALALLPAGAASAHDYLVSSSPAANSTVTAATPQITLTFDDIVLDDGGHGALVQVTDAAGRNFETDCASVEARNVTVPVALGAPGTYRVTWQIVSADGHPVSDSIQFTYSGPKAGDGREGPIAKCGATVTAPAAQATDAPAQASVSKSVVLIISVAGGVVVLAVIAVVLVIVLSRRRSGQRGE